MTRPTLAIIGTGPAGLACGYFLHKQFAITLYEKNNYIGGHANTVEIQGDAETIKLDTAFVIFNDAAYPLFKRLLAELYVPSMTCPMSFGFQIKPAALEYTTRGLTYCFCEPRNLVNKRFVKMLVQIRRFRKEAIEVRKDDQYQNYSIADYVKERGYGDDFLHHFLVALVSVVWSLPPEKMLDYPIRALVDFLDNHGALQGVFGRKRWKTIVNGSRSYVDRLIAPFKDRILMECGVRKVSRKKKALEITDSQGRKQKFDHVIFACHADQALQILHEPTPLERQLLSKFKYHPARVIVHTDPVVMPKNRTRWAGWNYLIDYDEDKNLNSSFTYYMNRLQKVSKRRHYFVTINDPGRVNKEKILKALEYEHPIFDVEAIKAQDKLHRLNQNGRTYFCGSYFKYGFHEDAFRSGLEVCRNLTGRKVW